MNTDRADAEHIPTPWPKRPDGTNKTMGEMTREERRAQWKDAAERARVTFSDPRIRAAIEATTHPADQARDQRGRE